MNAARTLQTFREAGVTNVVATAGPGLLGLADDMKASRDLSSEALIRDGFRVVAAGGGNEALTATAVARSR